MNISAIRERVGDAWWPIPTVCVLAVVLLAVALLGLDDLVDPPAGLGFEGSAGEARQVLSTIVSAMMSFTGLVFSISIVVFTLTSAQYSPRVLRTFLRDRKSQLTLGVFVATFVLALIALRAVTGPAGDRAEFVPGLTITAVYLLVAISIGLFVMFVNHITQEIRAVTIINRIRRETETTIDRRYPDPLGDRGESAAPDLPDPATAARVLRSNRTGPLARIRVPSLVGLARDHDVVFHVLPRVGDFVIDGRPLLHQYGEGGFGESRLRQQLILEEERSIRQDAAFGFRELVDIAERALSPGTNDPTTASQCIDQIHALLDRLSGRALEIGVHRDADGTVRLLESVPSWEDYVELACNELRHWGADSLQTQQQLRGMLEDLINVSSVERHPPLRRQLELLDERLGDLPRSERAVVRDGNDPAPR